MAHSGALTELPASILLPPTKSLFMITLDCWIVTVVIHQWLPCILQCRSSPPPSLWLSWSVGVWRMNILPFNSKTVRAIFFFWIFTLVMGAKSVVSILQNPMTYNRRSTMCKHVRRGEGGGGLRMMLVTTGLKANPCYGAIRKVLQKELAFMATKNVNKRIVRAIWCWLTVVSAIIYHVTKVLIFTKSLSPPPRAASFSLWHNFASLVRRLQAPID